MTISHPFSNFNLDISHECVDHNLMGPKKAQPHPYDLKLFINVQDIFTLAKSSFVYFLLDSVVAT